ncbi:hypothetical protein F4604DRAFT_1934257 [Suillus subluteus]|nr:hypothetical protein F4604DRAFT_1934257 [Suillus subluteus]
MPIVVSDDESTSGHVVSRPRRTVTLSSRLTDANNDATPELSAHRNKPPVPAISAPKPVPTSSKRGAKDVADEIGSDEGAMENGPHTSKRLRRIASADGEASFTDASSPSVIDTAEETPSTRNATPMDTEGFLSDVNVQDLSATPTVRREEKSRDISAFFGKPYAHKAEDGKTRTAVAMVEGVPPLS